MLLHYPHWAKESVRLETPRDRLITNRPLDRKRLQGDRTSRSAEQEVGTNANTHANRATRTHIGAGKRSASRTCGGCKYAPRHDPTCRDSDIETNCAHNTNICLRRTGTIGSETAGHALPGPKDQADGRRHLASERTDAGSRRLLGNCWRDERRSERNKHQRNEMFEHD